jgi:hypothetical protein
MDFQESNAPVVNDVTLQILLVTALRWNLVLKVIDILAKFLHVDPKKKIKMEIIKGMEGKKMNA